MTLSIKIAPVRKTIVVAVSPARAFEVFTDAIDTWWPKSHGVGSSPIQQSIIEPYVGGRWYSIHEDGSEAMVGRVRVWSPGDRFVVSWQISAEWKPDSREEYASEVEVRFIDEEGKTRVELEHRDFERMGEREGTAMRNAVDQGWPGLLALFTRAASNA